MQAFGLAITGAIAKLLRIGPYDPERMRLEEAWLQRDADELLERQRIRDGIEAINENLIGQEARGGARQTKEAALRILEREWGRRRE